MAETTHDLHWMRIALEEADLAASKGEIPVGCVDRKSTRLNSSHQIISYAVFCLKKKKRASAHPRRARRVCEGRSRRENRRAYWGAHHWGRGARADRVSVAGRHVSSSSLCGWRDY